MPLSRPRGTSGFACGDLILGRCGNPQNCLLGFGVESQFPSSQVEQPEKGLWGWHLFQRSPQCSPCSLSSARRWGGTDQSWLQKPWNWGFFHTLMVTAVLWQRILFAEATCAPRMEILTRHRNTKLIETWKMWNTQRRSCLTRLFFSWQQWGHRLPKVISCPTASRPNNIVLQECQPQTRLDPCALFI